MRFDHWIKCLIRPDWLRNRIWGKPFSFALNNRLRIFHIIWFWRSSLPRVLFFRWCRLQLLRDFLKLRSSILWILCQRLRIFWCLPAIAFWYLLMLGRCLQRFSSFSRLSSILGRLRPLFLIFLSSFRRWIRRTRRIFLAISFPSGPFSFDLTVRSCCRGIRILLFLCIKKNFYSSQLRFF